MKATDRPTYKLEFVGTTDKSTHHNTRTSAVAAGRAEEFLDGNLQTVQRLVENNFLSTMHKSFASIAFTRHCTAFCSYIKVSENSSVTDKVPLYNKYLAVIQEPNACGKSDN